jgi:hypothetical protein
VALPIKVGLVHHQHWAALVVGWAWLVKRVVAIMQLEDAEQRAVVVVSLQLEEA